MLFIYYATGTFLLGTGIIVVAVADTASTTTTAAARLNLALALLLVSVILVLSEIQDISPEKGHEMMKQHKEIQADQTQRHDGADPQDALALERGADVDGGEGEADVGEDKGPPVEAEAEGAVDGETADDGDGEEP